MDIIPKSELPSCTFSWTLGYLFENRTQMHMYSDQYINQENQFNYCVQQKQIYLDVVYGTECNRMGFVDIRINSVFVESLPFGASLMHYRYHLDQAVFSSEYTLDWKIHDMYSIHSYLFYTNMNCCIQFATQEVCLKRHQEFYLPPFFAPSIVIINRQRAFLMILPLVQHPDQSFSVRSLNANYSKSIVKEDQLCQVDVDFRQRREWVNGLFISFISPKTFTVYILTSVGNQSTYVDTVDIKNTTTVKFGYFSREPFSNLRLVTNALQICRRKDVEIQLIAFNQLKPHSGEFHFFNQETLRLQLPCSAVYTYQIIPQEWNAKQNRNRKFPFEINPQTGVVTSTKAVSGSFSVLGHYKQHNPVLSFYSVQPASVTIPLSVHYTDCSQLPLYRLVIEVQSQEMSYNRFGLFQRSQQTPLLFVENTRGSHTIVRPFCSMESQLVFSNIDGAKGVVSLFVGDLSLYSSSFNSYQTQLPLSLSIIQSKNYKERKVDELTFREYVFETGRMNTVLVDVLVIAKSIHSVTLNHQNLVSPQSTSHTSFVRVFQPLISDEPKQKVLIQYRSEGDELRVYTLLHPSFYYDSHMISTAVFNDTLFITSLHHERIWLNTIRFIPHSDLPSFTVERLENGQWSVIGGLNSNSLYPISLLLQLSNHVVSSQYRVHFSQPIPLSLSFQFGYEMPSLWKNSDVLTPGFRITVVKDCYNWVMLSDEELVKPVTAMLLRYNMYFDWVNEILFGTAKEEFARSSNERVDSPPHLDSIHSSTPQPDSSHSSTPQPDSIHSSTPHLDSSHSFHPQPDSIHSSTPQLDTSLLSSHIHLVNCHSSQVQIEVKGLNAVLDLAIRNDNELLFYIPSTLQLSSAVLCLDRNQVFSMTSMQPMHVEVTALESSLRTFLAVSPTPLLFSTFYRTFTLQEYALPSPSLEWHPVGSNSFLDTPFVFVRVPLKEESTLLRIEVEYQAVIVELFIDETKLIIEKEDTVCEVLVAGTQLIVKLRLLGALQSSQIPALMTVYAKEKTSIQEMKVDPADDPLLNPFHFSHAFYNQPLLHPITLRYAYPVIVSIHNLAFQYRLLHTPSLVLHIVVNVYNTSTVLHNALLQNASDWQGFSLQLPSPVYFTSLSFSFDFVPFSYSADARLLTRNLTLNKVHSVSLERDQEVIKEESKPLFDKLQTIVQEQEVQPVEKKKQRVFCKEEQDAIYPVRWPVTPGVTHVRRSCPSGGTLHRFCDSEGKWSRVDGKCKKIAQSESILHRAFSRSVPSRSTSTESTSVPNQTTLTESTSVPTQTTLTESTPNQSTPTHSNPIQTPPLRFCKEETINGTHFPSTLNNRTISVSCKQPTFGTLYRTCSVQGTWEEPVGTCSNCPKNSFSFYNKTAGETQCKQCPSGTVFIRGNPLNPVKCYGKYYSENGGTDCSLCEGETRGSKAMGNIACKECRNGVLVGMKCVNTTVCLAGDQKVKVGSLRMTDCEEGMRGKQTQMCIYKSGNTGVWGPINTEGCYSPVPAIGSYKMEIALTLQNVHSSIFRKKVDDNKNIRLSPAIQLIQQSLYRVLQTVFISSIQYVNYVDWTENKQPATRVHFVIEGKQGSEENITRLVSTTLQHRLPDLTMNLKEQNSYLFHYYFMVKKAQIVWYAENRDFCEAEDEWPQTRVSEVARKWCDSSLLGIRSRKCEVRGNAAVWSPENRTMCSNDTLQFTMRILLDIPYGKKGQRAYERKEYFEQLMEEVNCDALQEMRVLQFHDAILRGEDSFLNVFKDCRIKENRLVITFLSSVAPSLDFVEFFSKLAKLESISVIQEGQLLRSSFVLEFTSKGRKTCPSQYVFCNDKSVLSGSYCHYRMDWRTHTSESIF